MWDTEPGNQTGRARDRVEGGRSQGGDDSRMSQGGNPSRMSRTQAPRTVEMREGGAMGRPGSRTQVDDRPR